MVYLPEGKMKSREGTVVDTDDLIEEMINLTKEEIKKRHKKTSKKEMDKRAKQIGLAAIIFYLLKMDPLRDILYKPKESLSFEGETGPYIQYAHARISSILARTKLPMDVNYNLLKEPTELNLFVSLSNFPDIVRDASTNYKPNLIANYLIELAQKFNSFYNALPVLKAEKGIRDVRLCLISAVKQVLENGLFLLGIEAPERM
jgi:arginyl-tRNA synthetase